MEKNKRWRREKGKFLGVTGRPPGRRLTRQDVEPGYLWAVKNRGIEGFWKFEKFGKFGKFENFGKGKGKVKVRQR